MVPWFVSVTLLLAAVTFFWWWATDVGMALMAATAVLVITCPCAFGLATPMAIAVAAGLGAGHGVLVRNGRVLESLSQVTHIVFDKTGTLTEGRMQIHEVLTVPGMEKREILHQAAAVEQMSEHSIARAIRNEAKSVGLETMTSLIENFQSIPGRGVKAQVDGVSIVLGSQAWLIQNEVILHSDFIEAETQLQQQAVTCVHLAMAGREIGLIGIADQLRHDAKAVVEGLRASGIRMTLLSGDRRPVVEMVAAQLGDMEVMAEVLPKDKERIIAEFQRQGEIVAMVGDGVNDAPALARADVGIALGSATDISIASADLVLIGNELDKVRQALRLSRWTLRTVRQNIGISLVYNIIMVPLAMAALVTPLVAAVAMPISSLLVIGNAMRIRKVFSSSV
ncbi:membrane hypothetical protein [Gammaproteobacteria bacterium]